MTASLALVAAVARNGVIGADGKMPWRLSTDLKRFKELTLGKPVIMGRRTFESIGKPLPGRLNIVISRDPGFAAEGITVASSLDAAISDAGIWAVAHGSSEIMVIGGGTVYAQAIARADRLYITEVDAAPEGDTHFPAIDPATWLATTREHFAPGPRDSAATDFIVYQRRNTETRRDDAG